MTRGFPTLSKLAPMVIIRITIPVTSQHSVVHVDFTAKLHGQYMTALEMAAEKGYAGVVDLLLRHGQDPNHPSSYPALTTAAGKRHVHVARVLLDHGADIHIKCSTSMTALLHRWEV